MKDKHEIPFMGRFQSILVLTEPFFWRKLISIYKQKENKISKSLMWISSLISSVMLPLAKETIPLVFCLLATFYYEQLIY